MQAGGVETRKESLCESDLKACRGQVSSSSVDVGLLRLAHYLEEAALTEKETFCFIQVMI